MSETDINQFKSKYIRISSEDKNSNSDSNTRFEIDLQSTGGLLDNIVGFQVKYASCPNIFFNVPAYANQLALEDAVATSFPVTLAVNQYTIADLITEMTSKINTAIGPDTVVITQDAQQKLIFTFSAAYNFVFSGTSAAGIIGLTADTPNALVNNMQSLPNLTGESEIYIHSQTMAQSYLEEPSGSFSVVDVLALNIPFGAIAYSTYYDNKMQEIRYIPYESRRTFRTIDISLRNRQGQLLTMGDNFYFNMIIKAYYR